MIERGGVGSPDPLANVRQATIKILILAGVALGSPINTDEYAIYTGPLERGFGHKTVNHGRGEYACDEDMVMASAQSTPIPWKALVAAWLAGRGCTWYISTGEAT